MYFLVLLAIVVNTVYCSPFEVSVTTSDRYELGQDVICKVTITNTQGKDYQLFTRNTPLEGFKSKIFTVTKDGEKLRYDAFVFKRGLVEKNSDSIVIRAKESISVDADLSLAYGLKESGAYYVMVSTNVFYLNEKGNISRQRLNSKAPAKFNLVMTENLPKQTIAEKSRQAHVAEQLMVSQTDPTKAKDPIFSGNGDSVDEDTAKAVWQAAYQIITQSPDATKVNTQFKKWFGNPNNTGFKDTVVGLYQEIKEAMQDKQYTLYFKGAMCERNDFAYTSFESQTIYLCNSYFRAKDTHDYNSKMGTLIHELTHAVGDTEDYEYGTEECQNLAVDVPLSAINNADNYEYFCEEI